MIDVTTSDHHGHWDVEDIKRLCEYRDRLRAALFRHACHCGKQGDDPAIHSPWCPYRIACSSEPQTGDAK